MTQSLLQSKKKKRSIISFDIIAFEIQSSFLGKKKKLLYLRIVTDAFNDASCI